MGNFGYGYGSEFHLLRWMGRHREVFDKKVRDKLGVSSIKWIDFKFARGNKIPDRELVGLEFLKSGEGEIDSCLKSVKEVKEDFRENWPQTGKKMNWDAVGLADGKYVLCEAKARVGEIVKKHKLDDNAESAKKRLEAFQFATEKIRASQSAEVWLHNFYQMANRLFILALLDKHNIPAVLLNIYFCGDCFRGRTCPSDAKEWREKILDKEFNKLGIVNNEFVQDHVKSLFLHIDKEDEIAD